MSILSRSRVPEIDKGATSHDEIAPGVYIEEPSPFGAIEGVGTGTAALIGAAMKGPINVPIKITSWTEFRNKFGERLSARALHLAYAVRGFFDNGGTACYITRVIGARHGAGGMSSPECQAALDALETVDDVRLVCVPGRTDVASQTAIIGHCERQANRFAILDSPLGAPPSGAGSVLAHRSAVEAQRGHAALYYPWIRVNDPRSPTSDGTMLTPPSGHLAGIYARTDAEHGVHKAPANEVIAGAIGLERAVNDAEQGELNLAGVNVLRILAGREGPVVWGARTTAPTEDWRYVSVRRLLLFVEESLRRGLQWAVLELNDAALWGKLQRAVTEFLTRVWRSGALPGPKAKDAFYVRIDELLNPPSTKQEGPIAIEVGIAPVTPGEFIVLRIEVRGGPVES